MPKKRKKKTAKKTRKKSAAKTSAKRGRGRPPTREGNEVRKTVYLGPPEAAQLEGLIEFRKRKAIEEGNALGEVSETAVLADAWTAYFKNLSRSEKNSIRATQSYKEAMKNV